MNVTEQDYKTFKAISDGFSDTLIERHFGGDNRAAVTAFSRSISLWEKANMAVKVLSLHFASQADPETKSRRLLAYCESAVPGLTKVFGRQALVEALPETARDPKVAEMAEKLGAREIPALIREAMEAAP